MNFSEKISGSYRKNNLLTSSKNCLHKMIFHLVLTQNSGFGKVSKNRLEVRLIIYMKLNTRKLSMHSIETLKGQESSMIP
jgi:hypothetical protein